MKNRRAFLLTLTAGLVAMSVVVAPVIAEELFGVITKIDLEGQKITVFEKKADRDVELKINGDTEVVTPKGEADIEKLSKIVTKTQDLGKKGVPAKITHDKGVVSKITVVAKKAVPKPEN